MSGLENSTSGNPTILIATADIDLRKILHYLVKKQSFASEDADCMEETLKKARMLRPSIILLDFSLKGSEGFEALIGLQEEDETRSIPVVLLYDKDPGNFQKEIISHETNVKAALEKPVYPDDLTKALLDIMKERA
jgi:DNA-binding response OmpR family regulator